jgi:hypothetical protein
MVNLLKKKIIKKNLNVWKFTLKVSLIIKKIDENTSNNKVEFEIKHNLIKQKNSKAEINLEETLKISTGLSNSQIKRDHFQNISIEDITNIRKKTYTPAIKDINELYLRPKLFNNNRNEKFLQYFTAFPKYVLVYYSPSMHVN